MKAYQSRTTAAAIFCLSLLFAKICWGQDNCKSLMGDLESMRKAQKEILSSLVENQFLCSQKLQDFSSLLHNAQDRDNSSARLRTLEPAAQRLSNSFQIRGEKARTLARKFDESSLNLIQKLQKCLR